MHRTIAALALSTAALGVPAAIAADPPGRIGPSLRILNNGRHLTPYGRLVNVGNVKTKIIAELANGPTTPGADRVLDDQGVMLIPDILANAGGVTVSYYEWVQDQYSFFWSERQINDTLEQTIKKAFDSVYETAQQYNTDMRTGAYILAVARVAEATRVRGIFP